VSEGLWDEDKTGMRMRMNEFIFNRAYMRLSVFISLCHLQDGDQNEVVSIHPVSMTPWRHGMVYLYATNPIIHPASNQALEALWPHAPHTTTPRNTHPLPNIACRRKPKECIMQQVSRHPRCSST